MNNKIPPLWLLVLLIMFPQLVETIYSPALPDIAASFKVSHEQAAQTLSVYFVAFAFGVALWGRLSDQIGRRPAMLAGLLCYALGSVMALVTRDFNGLLVARMIAALGAAAGSVVVQTMLRDSYQSIKLAAVFSIMGAALSVSPVFGLVIGGGLVSQYGQQGVFITLTGLAGLLMLLTMRCLPETRPTPATQSKIGPLAWRMGRDGALWRHALLIALFNGMLFSYYSLAPFLFASFDWDASAFGWTGGLIAAASLFASLLNRRLLGRGVQPERLVHYACLLALLSGLLAWGLQHSPWILVAIAGIAIAYTIAIPNILSQALRHYQCHAGTASALFGLSYYLLLGLLLGIAALIQQLGPTLTAFALIAWGIRGRG
ncbi:Bcr/CflA subfamily drug resistance transporter [Orbus hercynius]|uniref:Bcr/CflA family efflux transporter n=1 Tax=Orbus hercynius TaxID=593135 RepID=A0A495RDE5_9GAMM|nr:multidrug effflux MFS transporter [Orbus hercynius]RKS85286.1 Bcr/CflA subfamily drug resistance transporter [Orbus hercynius]